MSIFNVEWNFEDCLEVAREEAREEVFEEAREEAVEKHTKIFKLFLKEKSSEEIAEALKIPLTEVEDVIKRITS